MLWKRMLLTVMIASFGLMMKSNAEEAPTIEIDALKGKITVRPTTQPAGEPTTEKATEPAPAVEERQETPELSQTEEEMTTEPEVAIEEVEPGEEERAAFLHVPKNAILLGEDNTCIGVLEEGKLRPCPLSDPTDQQ